MIFSVLFFLGGLESYFSQSISYETVQDIYHKFDITHCEGVCSDGNNVMFVGEINTTNVKLLDDAIVNVMARNMYNHIHIYIDSIGGYVNDGLEMAMRMVELHDSGIGTLCYSGENVVFKCNHPLLFMFYKDI